MNRSIMKNKGFTFLLIVFALAIGILIFSMILYFSLLYVKESQVSKNRSSNDFDTALDKALSSPTPTPPFFAIDNKSLVGIWHALPMMPSGWAEHYNFYPSGKYSYYTNSMDCARTKIRESGYWTLNSISLNLEVKTETVLVGGKLIPSSGSCASEKTLVGAKEKLVYLSNPKEYHFWLYPFTINNIETLPFYQGVLFDNTAYWKFGDDPTGYYYDLLKPEFPEPTEF